MRVYRYIYKNEIEIGIEKNKKIYKIEKYNNIINLLNNGYNKSENIEKLVTKNSRNLDEIKLLSPIEKPIHDIVCVGRNYVEHISELGGDITNGFIPNYFGKRAIKILGDNSEIKGFFNVDNEVDYEVELAVIISKEGKKINRDNYKEYIFGFSIFNDISSRHLQYYHKQWYRGKSMDNYTALGPCIVTVDEFQLPLDLNISTKVNGEIRQNSNTKKMIFQIDDILVDLSSTMTLEAGDIIATGTPSGVGKGFEPPKYLKKGDIVEMKIDNIGKIKNKFI